MAKPQKPWGLLGKIHIIGSDGSIVFTRYLPKHDAASMRPAWCWCLRNDSNQLYAWCNPLLIIFLVTSIFIGDHPGIFVCTRMSIDVCTSPCTHPHLYKCISTHVRKHVYIYMYGNCYVIDLYTHKHLHRIHLYWHSNRQTNSKVIYPYSRLGLYFFNFLRWCYLKYTLR